MRDIPDLYRFFTSTRPKRIGVKEKILKTLLTHQVVHERGATLSELAPRCAYFASRGLVEAHLSSLIGVGMVEVEMSENGRKFEHLVSYEGLRKLNDVIEEYKAESEAA